MYIQAKDKGETGSKAQSYYSAEQARESGTQGSLGLWGYVPSGKYKYYNFFVLIASSSIKISAKR